MFYNGKKTLGVFINRAELEFQQILSKSLIETAQVKNYNVAFMTSYGIRENKNMYDAYENAIVDFAPIQDFDAIIVALDTYDTPVFRKKLIHGLRTRAACPVISFREESDEFYSVLTDANQLVDELVKHFIQEHHAEEFYLCLLGETDGGVRYFNKDISAKAKLEMAFRRGADISVQESEFYQKELLPECVCDGALKVYYFSILHNREKCFGYTVLSFRNSVDCLDIFYHDWNLTISLALNDYFIRKQMEKLVKKNEEESITDYLCGMYNRCGMERYIKKNWKNWVWDKKRIIFISVDLDGLKGINDTYGHKEGDWAICAVAESVKAAVEGCCVAARTGGDEFVAVLEEQYECAAEIVQLRIRQMLDEKNRRGQKPYRVDCSVGYYVTDINENSSYDACIRHSDMKMYRMKQQKAARAHK